MNQLSISICIFLVLLYMVHMLKPPLLYEMDGTLRQFGIGYRKKTILPIWLIVIVLSILAYTVSIYITP